jgi:hypothetical protein
MNTAEALAECLRHLEEGGDLQECLSRFPGKEQALVDGIATWQLVGESVPEISARLPVSREAFYMQIARQKAPRGLPASIKFAVFAATASLATLVLLPGSAYGLLLSLSGSVAWLSWWLLSFMPRLYGLRTRSASLSG